MAFAMQPLSLDDYARCVRAEGGRVIQRGGVWWREVRPFFFRPLLPLQELAARQRPPTWAARIGGFQYRVPASQSGNSVIRCILFPDAANYDARTLDGRRRWEIRTAQKKFSLRVFAGVEEFIRLAHPVYLSFYARTRYDYHATRVQAATFGRWANRVFAVPGSLVLGAFEGEILRAVSISRLLGDTVHYATFFAHSDAMRHHVSSLMLHAVRESARESGLARTVFAGMQKSGRAKGVDDFYLHRGAVVASCPAHLEMNGVVRMLVRSAWPTRWRELVGDVVPRTGNGPTDAALPTQALRAVRP